MRMHAGVAMLCVLQCGMYWDGSTICIYVLGLHVAVELPLLCCGWRLLWSPSALPSALHPRFSSTLHPLFIHSPSALHPLSSALSTLHPLSIRCCCLRTCATRSATAISLLLSDGSSAQVIVAPVICVGRMPAQARDRSRSRDRSWHVGDQFVIIGPPWSRWYPGKRGGWQPKFWWGHPDDRASAPVVPAKLFIDTSGTFTVTDLHVQDSGPRFVSVQIRVDGYRVWTNVAKHGVPWARQSR